MATTPRKPSPDTSVSNQATEAAEATKKPVSKPPSEGTDAKVAKPGVGGAEAVAGFQLPKEMAAAMDAVYTAPEKTMLRDIAEASFGPPPVHAETVHGPDNRVKITTTAAYPWRVRTHRHFAVATHCSCQSGNAQDRRGCACASSPC